MSDIYYYIKGEENIMKLYANLLLLMVSSLLAFTANIFIVPLGLILRFSLFILIVMSLFDVNEESIVCNTNLKNETKGFTKTSLYLCGMTIVNHKFLNVSWIFLHFIHQ